ncbi:MAG: hypothetical protein H2069_00215 [Legionella sp.]|nr:hypothetical protein [Legionella sp.]
MQRATIKRILTPHILQIFAVNRFEQIISFSCVMIPVVFVLLTGLIRPLYNWDMIGYVAAAYHQDGYRDIALHHQTYADIKKIAPVEDFNTLIEGPYKAELFKSPEALAQHVPFYAIKKGYIQLMRILSLCGLNYAQATYVISAIFAALSTLLLSQLMRANAIKLYWLPFIVVAFNIPGLATLSTPDAMACFFSLLIIHLLQKKKKSGFVLAAFLPYIRTDFILLSWLVALYAYKEKHNVLCGLTMIGSLILMGLINVAHDSYSWLTLFNFTLVEYNPYPADLVPLSGWENYIRIYLRGIKKFLIHPHSLIYFIAFYVGWYSRKGFKVYNHDTALLLVLPLGFVVSHFLLFPSYLDRWFMFPVLLVLIWLLKAIALETKDCCYKQTMQA